MNEEIIELMRQIEPNYNYWTDSEIQNQLNVIYECGYEWVGNGERGGFKHKDSGVYLKIEGLNYFPPEKLKETYENVWAKDFEGVKAKTHLGKVFKSLLLFITVLLISLIFYSTPVTIIIIPIFLIYIGYHYFKYRINRKISIQRRIENEKKDGNYVDESKIKWCSNCVHFRKVKGWLENDLNLAEYLLPEEKIPCKIFSQTKDTWINFFNSNTNDRYLYPMDCDEFKGKK